MPPPLMTARCRMPMRNTPQTVAQYATDVATFLQWSADPHVWSNANASRIVVLAFLVAPLGLLFLAYKGKSGAASHWLTM